MVMAGLWEPSTNFFSCLHPKHTDIQMTNVAVKTVAESADTPIEEIGAEGLLHAQLKAHSYQVSH